MKRNLSFITGIFSAAAIALPVSAVPSSTMPSGAHPGSQNALILLAVISGVMLLFSVVFTALSISGFKKKSHKRSTFHAQRTILILTYGATFIVVICTAVSFFRYRNMTNGNPVSPQMDVSSSPDSSDPSASQSSIVPGETTESSLPTPTIPPIPTISPMFTDNTNPQNWGIKWEIIESGKIVDSYTRKEPITFGKPEDYFCLPGISTFRGNNYRTAPFYGHGNTSEGTLELQWKRDIGSLNGWPGSGWTGQPLIVEWDDETKQVMNLYDSKKQKEGLVEVILATLDGNVYFYDLDDGSYTRDPVNLGMNFKGAGSLDPRGYPLMYVGSGDTIGDKSPRMYIVSLIDGSILYQKSGSDAFSQRDWVAFDSSPLVDAETDTLIWPGESGILYTIKLNTQYDKTAGTISIAPEETVKTRYYPERYNADRYWIGFEPSCVIVDHYLYDSENGGMFFCIDLNTMELVWAQDTRDDSNSTPAFEWDDDGNGYLYTAPSLHWTAQNEQGQISIYKLNAKTGEIVWEVPFDCYTVKDLSGGVQSTPLLGKPGTELEGMIFYTIARTPQIYNGIFVAMDTKTGEIKWKLPMEQYAWSSPVPIYNEDGTAYIVICDSVGNMKLVNAKGEVVSSLNLGSNIEASPAVFNDTLVVGTRGQLVNGIKIK